MLTWALGTLFETRTLAVTIRCPAAGNACNHSIWRYWPSDAQPWLVREGLGTACGWLEMATYRMVQHY